MATYITENGRDEIRIDNGSNTFVNGQCVNPLNNSEVTLQERALEELSVEPVQLIVPEVEVTGHVSVFEYGQDPDNDDKPYQVNTGHESW